MFFDHREGHSVSLIKKQKYRDMTPYYQTDILDNTLCWHWKYQVLITPRGVYLIKLIKLSMSNSSNSEIMFSGIYSMTTPPKIKKSIFTGPFVTVLGIIVTLRNY